MNDNIITVSDRAAFDRALKLVRSKHFKAQVVERDGAELIKDGELLFRRAERGGERGGRNKSALSLTERFDRLYAARKKEDGDTVVSETAAWNQFLVKMTDEFYQRFSLLVYEPVRNDDGGEKREALKKLFEELLKDRKQAVYIEETGQTATKRCIAAVKLTFELGGQPVQAIIPFYFAVSQDMRDLTLIKSDKAYQLHESIAAMKKTAGGGESNSYDKKVYADLAGRVMTKLEDDILKDGLDLKDYIVADGGIRRQLTAHIIKRLQIKLKDENAVRGLKSLPLPELLKKAESVNESIVVKDAKIRYIAAFDYFGRTFSCYDKQDSFLKNKLFDVSFDVNQKVTVVCAKCGAELIADGKMAVSNLDVDLSKPDCGLSALKSADNPFLRHVRPMYCKEVGCRRLVCPGDVKTCGKFHIKGKKECTREFCLNCPHEEIATMVELENGQRVLYHTTPDLLAYCRDTLSLLPREKTRKCATCGRTYSKAAKGFEGDNCAFCAPIVKGSTDQRYRNLYKKNCTMLPLSARPKNGVCNEDGDLILFKVRGRLYRLDKKSDGGKSYLKVTASPR